MRIVSLSIVLFSFLVPGTRADCHHPNGLIQTDPYHAPCGDVLNNSLNTMCCAIDRPNPPGGFSTNGYNADVCLPNGLCLQSWKRDENSTVTIEYYREECTVQDWKIGKCLSVCLSNSVCNQSVMSAIKQLMCHQISSNVMMTPCDDTANSTRWCCGTSKDCCSGDIGVETLAQTFLGMVATSISGLSTSATASASVSTSGSNYATSAASPSSSSSLSGGAIAGIVIGALAGVALIGAAWYFIARRRQAASSSPPVYVEGNHIANAPKTYYTYEADGVGPQVSEVSAANVKDHDGRTRVHEMQ